MESKTTTLLANTGEYITSFQRYTHKDNETCIYTVQTILTHFSQETPKRVIGKLCRPRSDAAFSTRRLIRVYNVCK